MFRRLGYESEGADVSTALLDFTKSRLDRRGEQGRLIDLNAETLEAGRYDVITAIDTLVHVPDFEGAIATLHRALKPGGILFANFDTRPPSDENAWHLYSNDLPLRWTIQRMGFEPVVRLDNMITQYRHVEPTGVEHLARGLRDLMLLRSPLRPAVRLLRSLAQRTGEKISARRNP
jgi:ubiquinone/menaquinone biosynthesis C-methylase UbiE